MEAVDKITERFKFRVSSGKQAKRVDGLQTPLPKGEIVLAPSSHIAEEIFYGEGEYRTTFRVNDAFKPAKSHAGEVDMLHTYAPNAEYGEEGTYPCLAILSDDVVYTAVEAVRRSLRKRVLSRGCWSIRRFPGPFTSKRESGIMST